MSVTAPWTQTAQGGAARLRGQPRRSSPSPTSLAAQSYRRPPGLVRRWARRSRLAPPPLCWHELAMNCHVIKLSTTLAPSCCVSAEAMNAEAASDGRWTRASLDRAFALFMCALVAPVTVGRVLGGGAAADLSKLEMSCLQLMASVIAFSFTPCYSRGGRRWVLAACRLLFCAWLPPGAQQPAYQLRRSPAGPAVDAARILLGACTHQVAPPTTAVGTCNH